MSTFSPPPKSLSSRSAPLLRTVITSFATILLAFTIKPTKAADNLPDLGVVSAALHKATEFYATQLSSHGGYARAWTLNPRIGYVEGKESPSVISIQPFGTTTVGLSMLKAWQATGDLIHRDAARAAAQALINCQLESGGWSDDFDFDADDPARYRLRKPIVKIDETRQKKLRNLTTLDDDKTQSAMLFLLELAHDPAFKDDKELHDSLAYAFDHLLAAQAKNGGWPQQFDSPADPNGKVKKASFPQEWPHEYPKQSYYSYYTLNDDNLLNTVNLLLRAWELTGNIRYLDSAKRCGDFLLLAQFEGDQAAWAQQYNEDMEPVWARKFEPPALTSTESIGACRTLVAIWLATGEEKYRAVIEPALDWLERSRLDDGGWSRFYELRTNRPLYMTAETYQLTYDGSNTPTHYSFHPKISINTIQQLRKQIATPREELLAARKAPDSPDTWMKRARSLRSKVDNALAQRNTNGVWEKSGKIDATPFTQNMDLMSGYVAAMQSASKR